MKWIKGLGVVFAVAVIISGATYLFRSNPIGPIAGKALTGELSTSRVDWTLCNKHDEVAIESRSEAPYSVLTWCFVHKGNMYIPAFYGGTKAWSHFAAADPNVRIKMGDTIYEAKAKRITNYTSTPFSDFMNSLAEKYPTFEGRDMKEALSEVKPAEIWLFRISHRN